MIPWPEDYMCPYGGVVLHSFMSVLDWMRDQLAVDEYTALVSGVDDKGVPAPSKTSSPILYMIHALGQTRRRKADSTLMVDLIYESAFHQWQCHGGEQIAREERPRRGDDYFPNVQAMWKVWQTSEVAIGIRKALTAIRFDHATPNALLDELALTLNRVWMSCGPAEPITSSLAEADCCEALQLWALHALTEAAYCCGAGEPRVRYRLPPKEGRKRLEQVAERAMDLRNAIDAIEHPGPKGEVSDLHWLLDKHLEELPMPSAPNIAREVVFRTNLKQTLSKLAEAARVESRRYRVDKTAGRNADTASFAFVCGCVLIWHFCTGGWNGRSVVLGKEQGQLRAFVQAAIEPTGILQDKPDNVVRDVLAFLKRGKGKNTRPLESAGAAYGVVLNLDAGSYYEELVRNAMQHFYGGN